MLYFPLFLLDFPSLQWWDVLSDFSSQHKALGIRYCLSCNNLFLSSAQQATGNPCICEFANEMHSLVPGYSICKRHTDLLSRRRTYLTQRGCRLRYICLLFQSVCLFVCLTLLIKILK